MAPTDQPTIATTAKATDAAASIRRPGHSRHRVCVDQVPHHETTEIEAGDRISHLLMSLEIAHPSRHAVLMDKLDVGTAKTGAVCPYQDGGETDQNDSLKSSRPKGA